MEERVFTEKKPNALVEELLDEPVGLQVIKIGHRNLYSVTCLKKEEIWTSGHTADIKCFNTQCVLQKTIKTKSCPIDIAVYRDGFLLYSDERTVYKVQDAQTEVIIMLQGWNPSQLCATSSGDILVTMYNDD